MLYLYMRYKKPSGFLNDKEEFSMQYLGIEYNMKHTPKLDPQFVPLRRVAHRLSEGREEAHRHRR